MKHISFLSIILLASMMLSCSQKTKFEGTAKKQMEATFKELAKDPSSVKLSNYETVFKDDSLCIIHVDFIAKNGLGVEVKDRCEYIYISSNGKCYESYQEISSEDEGVFVSPEKYENNKKGTIYESLPYESGLRYLAARYVNGNGREAGNRDGDSFSIPVPTGTGSWDVKVYKDEFGEDSTTKYLVLMGSGVFSNSATTNSDLTALFYIDKDYDFSFKLIEYNSNVVKSDDSYDYRIKDSSGEIHDIVLYNDDDSGQMSVPTLLFPSDSDSDSDEAKEIIKRILKKGGTITVSVTERFSSYTHDSYLFKLDVTGFEKAMSYL